MKWTALTYECSLVPLLFANHATHSNWHFNPVLSVRTRLQSQQQSSECSWVGAWYFRRRWSTTCGRVIWKRNWMKSSVRSFLTSTWRWVNCAAWSVICARSATFMWVSYQLFSSPVCSNDQVIFHHGHTSLNILENKYPFLKDLVSVWKLNLALKLLKFYERGSWKLLNFSTT